MSDIVATFSRLRSLRGGSRFSLLAPVMLLAFAHCATTSKTTSKATSNPAPPASPVQVGPIVGLYKLSSMGGGDHSVFLWITAGEGDEVRVNLLARLWTARPVQQGTLRFFVAADPRAPRVRAADNRTLVVDHLDEALRSKLGALPLRFVRHSRDGFERALTDLANGREFLGVHPDTDAPPTNTPALRISASQKMVCKGQFCDLLTYGECKRTTYVLAGFANALEGGPPGGPLLLQTAARAGATSADCANTEGYQYFDKQDVALLARLDSDHRLGIILLAEGMGQQPYVPAGWTEQRAARELTDWEHERHLADHTAQGQAAPDPFQRLADATLEEPERVTAFIEFAQGMEKRAWDPVLHTRVVENVIHEVIAANRNADARRVFDLFLTHLLPQIRPKKTFEGAVGKSAQEIAADMLIVVARESDNALFDKVYSRALGGEAAIAVSTHGRVLFNLACYYALTSQKPQMLTAMGRALRQGEDPDRFRIDADFTAYKSDPDFQRLLATHDAGGAR